MIRFHLSFNLQINETLLLSTAISLIFFIIADLCLFASISSYKEKAVYSNLTLFFELNVDKDFLAGVGGVHPLANIREGVTIPIRAQQKWPVSGPVGPGLPKCIAFINIAPKLTKLLKCKVALETFAYSYIKNLKNKVGKTRLNMELMERKTIFN
uniref:Uncharacterized protein n=1 Tax=Romanomermis culicivorax TaxID=13658 RepID=A0A915K086_ROMCU